jgi:sugar phosphate isomerase/epimerase
VKIGICTQIENAAALKAAGADYIEVGVQKFLKPADDNAAFEASLKLADQCPLPISAANGFIPGDLRSTGPDYNPDGVLAYAAVAFERAAQVGITRIVFGSGGSRQLPEGFSQAEAFDQFTDLLSQMGPLAESQGVTVVVEPLGPECNFIKSLAEGAAAVHKADHPNIRLLADSFHMIRIDEPGEKITPVMNLIAHVHVAELEGRRAPGVAGDDFTPYLKPLAEGGYTGGVSIESSWPDGLEADAAKAVATLRAQGEAAGLT